MKTYSFDIVSSRTDAGTVCQIINYRGINIIRQFDNDGFYAPTVEFNAVEIDFNSMTGAINFIEDELNRIDELRYYPNGFDPSHEFGVKVI